MRYKFKVWRKPMITAFKDWSLIKKIGNIKRETEIGYDLRLNSNKLKLIRETFNNFLISFMSDSPMEWGVRPSYLRHSYMAVLYPDNSYSNE